MRAELEFKQPNVPDPVHLRAEELLQLSPTLFKGIKVEVYSSRLPSLGRPDCATERSTHQG